LGNEYEPSSERLRAAVTRERPRPPASAVLRLQQTVGNAVVVRLLRDFRGTMTTPDTELRLGGKRVTVDILADWVHRTLGPRIDQSVLRARILSSHDFEGSDEAKRYWATYLDDHFSGLQLRAEERIGEARERGRKQIEAEREAERREAAAKEVEAFKKKTYEGDYALGFGFFYADYDPRKGTLTVSVPVRFEFHDSDENRVEIIDPTSAHPQMKPIHEPKSWGADKSSGRSEREVWRETFIRLAEGFWSHHLLSCTRPGWENVWARVVVKVDDAGNEPRAGHEPFKLDVYRGDTPSGSEYVTKGRAELGFTDVQTMVTGDHPVAVHEFGHLLGFDDEYEAPDKPGYAGHSELVRGEFGYGVPRLDSKREDRFKDSIMFRHGGEVLVEHGVIFLDALRNITGVHEWKLSMY
jgi:hypothetical protein